MKQNLNLSGTEAKTEVFVDRINSMTELILLPKEKAEAQGEKTSYRGQVPKIVGVKDKSVMQVRKEQPDVHKERTES